MFNNVQDPRIAQGFQALAGVFGGGSAADIIQADLDRRRGGLIDAQTRTEGGQLAAANALAGLRGTQSAEIQQQMGALAGIASALTGQDYTTPEGRAALTGLFAQAGLGVDEAVGATTFTHGGNPFPSEQNFSDVLLGTGVVSGWGNTPTGTAQDLAGQGARNDADNLRALEEVLIQGEIDLQEAQIRAATTERGQDIGAETARDRIDNPAPRAGSGADGSLNPLDLNRVFDMFVETVSGLSGGEADPAEWAGARVLLDQALRDNQGNAVAAIQQVLRGLPRQEVTVPGTGFLGMGRDTRSIPDPSGLAGLFAPGGAAPPPDPTPTPAVQTGQRAQLPNGSVVVWDGAQWVPE